VRKIIVPFCALFLISGAAVAQVGVARGSSAQEDNPNAESSEDSSSSQPDAERRICRRAETTATRLGDRRVCMTARQWRDHDRNQ
jgi:hypothetical protein